MSGRLEVAAIEVLPAGYRLRSPHVLEFSILGPVEVIDDGRPLRLGGPKQRAALAILLLSANRVVSVERLADDLYAGAPPVTAVTQVQRQVSELRKILGAEAIETRSPGYALHLEPEQLDLANSSAGHTRQRRRSTEPTPKPPLLCSERLSTSGAAPRSPTWPISRSRRRRSDASRS